MTVFDPYEVLRVLEVHRVRYVVVGGRDLEARVRVPGVPDGLPFEHDARMLAAQQILDLVTRAGELGLVLHPAGTRG